MKIRKIHFKNINSLRGEHIVDFTVSPLLASQLFAITGPTGSGKSTILDVISLSLYCRVPRLGKITKKVISGSGAILTRNTNEAFASVEYECNKGVFRSTWSISTSRNNTLRDYEMELSDLASNNLLELKKSDIPGKNEEFIGLNYDQFIKSILLAQGEFAEFLKVNKSERGELLEKITGTGIYRDLGKKAFEKKNQFAKTLEDLRLQQLLLKDSLLLDEELLESQKRDEELRKIIQKKEVELQQQVDQLKLRKEVSQIMESIELKNSQYSGRKDILQAFQESEGLKIKLHEATSVYAENLNEWKQNGDNIYQSTKDLETLIKSTTEQELKRNDLLEDISELLKSHVDPEHIKVSLDMFQNEVQKLVREIEVKQQDYESKKSELAARGESWGFSTGEDDPDEELIKLKRLKTETAQEINQLQEKLKGVSLEASEKERQRLETELNALRQGKEWNDQLVKIQGKIRHERNLLNQKVASLNTIPGNINRLKDEKEKAELRVRALKLEVENQKLRSSLEDKRTELQNGKPCPLCGSKEHPWAVNAPEPDNTIYAQLDKDENKLLTVRQEIIRSEEKMRTLEEEKESLAKRIKGLQTEVEELNAKLTSECGRWLSNKPDDWDSLIHQKKSQRESLNKISELKLKANGIKSCLPVVSSMIGIRDEVKDLTKKKNALFTGADITKTCGNLRGSWLSTEHQMQTLSTQTSKLKKELEALQLDQTQLDKELTPSLREIGFEGIDDAISKRLREDDYQQLNRKLNQLKESYQSAQVELKSFQDQLSEKQKRITGEKTEDLSEKIEEQKSELSEIRDINEEVRRKLKNHNENLQKVEDLQKCISEEEKTGRKWELLNQLIGDATGKRFNDFAQDLTLQQLLALANNQLTQLSDRYKVASPLDEEDDSLVAIDNHMGGQRRSVKTLSGGETFILSLSLALALSDLAAKNVEINSLFIDEGFGTLDPETLDQTIDPLEKLQTESSKTIGIISHVKELKDRIHTQIQLEQNGQGYSSLRVV